MIDFRSVLRNFSAEDKQMLQPLIFNAPRTERRRKMVARGAVAVIVAAIVSLGAASSVRADETEEKKRKDKTCYV
jgi:hypothetical protein